MPPSTKKLSQAESETLFEEERIVLNEIIRIGSGIQTLIPEPFKVPPPIKPAQTK